MTHGTKLWFGVLAAVLVPVLARAQHYVQDNYRWRNDDGSEAAASWKADANTALAGVRRTENLRLRFAVKETSGSAGFWPVDATLAYATAPGGPWTTVSEPLATGELTDVVAMAPTVWFISDDPATWGAEYTPTTAQLGGGGGFVSGRCFETQALGTLGAVVGAFASSYTNVEYAIQLAPSAPRNTTYYFRVGRSATGMFTRISEWTVLAQLTVEDADYTDTPRIVSSLDPQNVAGGVHWSYTIEARGLFPLQYAVSGMPQGLTLSGNVLSGIPTQYGTFPVTLTVSDANGPTVVVLTLNVSEPAAEVIVDDADAAHTTKAGSWPASTSTTGAWNGACVYGDPAGETEALSFRWTPEIPLTADYQVYVRWTAGQYRGRHVPYTIMHAGGTTPETFVDQRDPALAGQWNLLGTYTFNLGTSGWVELGGHDGQACADAVRFVRVGAGNQPPTIVSAAWADANPVTLPAGTTVHVVAGDPDGDALTYAWSQVSGAGTATFAAPTAAASGVTFSVAGTYGLRVTVSDGRGGSVTSDVSVTANPGSGVDPRADANGDGVVNALDLQIVIANFGQTVP